MANSFSADWAAGDVLTATELNKVGLVKIAEISGAATNYDFASITSGFWGLLCVGEIRSDQAALVSSYVRFNNDGAANYDHGAGSGTFGATQIVLHSQNLAQSDANADVFSPFWLLVMNYKNTAHFKECLMLAGGLAYDGATGGDTQHRIGQWKSTAAIDRLNISASAGGFAAESVAVLYGVNN